MNEFLKQQWIIFKFEDNILTCTELPVNSILNDNYFQWNKYAIQTRTYPTMEDSIVLNNEYEENEAKSET